MPNHTVQWKGWGIVVNYTNEFLKLKPLVGLNSAAQRKITTDTFKTLKRKRELN